MDTLAPMLYVYGTDTSSLASSPPPTSHSSLLLLDVDQNADRFHSNGRVEAFLQKPLPAAPYLLRRTSSVYSHKSTSVLEPQEAQSQRWMSKMEFYLQPEQLRHSTPNVANRTDPESPVEFLVKQRLTGPTTITLPDDDTSIPGSQKNIVSTKALEPACEYRYWIQPNWTNFEPLFKSPRTPPNPPRPEEYLKESSSYAPSEEVFAEFPSSLPVSGAVDMSRTSIDPPARAGCQNAYALPSTRVDAVPLLELDAEIVQSRPGRHRRSSHLHTLPKRRESGRKSKTEVSDCRTASSEEPFPRDDADPRHTGRKLAANTPQRRALKSLSNRRSGNVSGAPTKETTRLVPAPILVKLTTSHRRACSTNSTKERSYRDPEKLKERASIADMLHHVREGNSFYSPGNSNVKRSTIANSSGKGRSLDRPPDRGLKSPPPDKKSVTFLETSKAVSLISSRKSTPMPSNGNQNPKPKARASNVSIGLKDRLANSVSPMLTSLTSSMGGLKRSVATTKSEKRKEDLKKSIKMVEGSFR